MATTSASPSTDTSRPAAAARRLVWDLPTRLFHWLLVGAFALAYATSDSETWRAVHVLAGYTAAGLVAFRLLWGVLGTRYARFTGFAFAPSKVFAYLRSLLRGRPQHYTGHNPAGSWAVLALLGLVALTAASGWAVFGEIGPEWIEDVHETLANATVAMVVLHVAAVIVSSALHRENLARAMVTGRKATHGDPAAAGTRWLVGVALLGAVIAFWGGWIPAPGLDRAPGFASLATPALSADGRGERRAGDRRRDERERRDRRDRRDDD